MLDIRDYEAFLFLSLHRNIRHTFMPDNTAGSRVDKAASLEAALSVVSILRPCGDDSLYESCKLLLYDSSCLEDFLMIEG